MRRPLAEIDSRHRSGPFSVGLFLLATLLFAGSVSGGERERLLGQAESADGRVQVRATVSPAEPRLSDTIRLTLTVRSDPTLRVEMPSFGDKLGSLRITDRSERTVAVTEDHETKALVLTLVPTRGGATPIWPMDFSYTDRREELRDRSHPLRLPATELVVDAEVSPEDASLEKIPDARRLIDIPNRGSVALAILVFSGIVLALGLLLLTRRRRVKRFESAMRFSDREIAMQKLTELFEKRLHETDVKQFYMELTGVVRWFLEQQTEIRAPELTTEEFLHEFMEHTRRRSGIPPQWSDRLKLFLESSDMVKFAKFKPSPDDIMLGFRRAEEFITAFRLPEENDGPASPDRPAR